MASLAGQDGLKYIEISIPDDDARSGVFIWGDIMIKYAPNSVIPSTDYTGKVDPSTFFVFV